MSGLGASHPPVYRKCRAGGVATLGLSLRGGEEGMGGVGGGWQCSGEGWCGVEC